MSNLCPEKGVWEIHTGNQVQNIIWFGEMHSKLVQGLSLGHGVGGGFEGRLNIAVGNWSLLE